MKATRNEEIIITLVLNQDEAEWLKGVMQRAINCTLDMEREQDREMRSTFWDALGTVDIASKTGQS